MIADRGADPSQPQHLLTRGAGDSRYAPLSDVVSRQQQLDALRAELYGDGGYVERLLAVASPDRDYTVNNTDLFGGVSWTADYDPHGLFSGSGSPWWTGGDTAKARFRIPVAGRYRVDAVQFMDRSGSLAGSVACKILARTGDGSPTVTSHSVATDHMNTLASGEGPLHAWLIEYFEEGTFIYWSSWAAPYKNLRQAGFGGIETKTTLRWMGSN